MAKLPVPKVRLRPRTASGVKTSPVAATPMQERVEPARHLAGAPRPSDPEFWTLINEISDPVPIAPAELDVIESYFSAVLDAVFDPGRKTSTST